MKFFFLSLIVVLLAGCATSPGGTRMGVWETLETWDESLSATEKRLGEKRYN